jgi:hypothetical protein
MSWIDNRAFGSALMLANWVKLRSSPIEPCDRFVPNEYRDLYLAILDKLCNFCVRELSGLRECVKTKRNSFYNARFTVRKVGWVRASVTEDANGDQSSVFDP